MLRTEFIFSGSITAKDFSLSLILVSFEMRKRNQLISEKIYLQISSTSESLAYKTELCFE